MAHSAARLTTGTPYWGGREAAVPAPVTVAECSHTCAESLTYRTSNSTKAAENTRKSLTIEHNVPDFLLEFRGGNRDELLSVQKCVLK